jgi:hypothetical protein
MADWTEEEIATLRDIMLTTGSLRKNLNRLPGRSYFAASTKCTELGIRRHTTEERVLSAMEDGKNRTALELAPLTHASRKHVAEILSTLSAPGQNQRVHVTGTTKEQRSVPIFKIGKGKNNLRFIPNAHRGASNDPEALLDKKHRSSGRWWPNSDPVVMDAMAAMVHAGRSSA